MRGLMLGLATLVVITAAPAWAAEWKTVRDAEAHVTIDMPGAYKTEPQTNKTELGAIPGVNYSVTTGSAYYVLSASNFGNELGSTPAAEILEPFVDGAIEGMSATKTSTRKITVSGAEGRDVTYTLQVEGVAVSGRMRVLYRNGWVYAAQALTFGQDDNTTGDRFLGSLRLLD